MVWVPLVISGLCPSQLYFDITVSQGCSELHDLVPFLIISPDESRGYIGFRSVAPPP